MRRIGDVIVELGFASREAVDRAADEARGTGRTTGQTLLDRRGGHPRPARACGRRAVRHRPRGPQQLPGRPGRCRVGRPTRAAPLQGGADRVPRRAHAARGHRGSGQRAGDGRPVDDDRATRSAAPRPLPRTWTPCSAGSTAWTRRCWRSRRRKQAANVIELRESAEDAPVVKLVHTSWPRPCSAAHPTSTSTRTSGSMRVRFRVDGVMTDSTTVRSALAPGLGLPDQDHG